MTTLIESFKGTCRGNTIDYTLMQVENEYILEGYNSNDDTLDSITWTVSTSNKRLIDTAIKTIKARE